MSENLFPPVPPHECGPTCPLHHGGIKLVDEIGGTPPEPPPPKAPIRIEVPAETWGTLVAAYLSGDRWLLVNAAQAFMGPALQSARPTDGSGCVGCRKD